MKPIFRQTLRHFWNQAKKYKISFALTVISQIVIIVGGFMLIPIFLKEFIDTITNFSGTNRMEIYPELLKIFLTMVSLEILCFWIFGRIFDFAITSFESKAKRDLENLCFENLQQHSFNFFANSFVGSIVSKVKRFSRAFERIADIFFFNLISNSIRYFTAIAVIWYFAPIIGIFLTIWMIVYFVVIYFISLKWKIHKDRRAAKMDSRFTGALADSITNVTTVKIFARVKFEISNFGRVVNDLFKARRNSWYASNIMNIFQSTMTSIMSLGSLYLMLRLWLYGQITVGTMVLFQAYLMQIYQNMWELGRILRDFYTALIDSEEMVEILEQTPDILDPEKPEKCRISKGGIKFGNVHFSYEEKTKVFANFDLKVRPGGRIGLVGESGAGKTTITKLLLRFADIDSGDIAIDGQSIYSITQDDLRRNISYVPQEPILFHRSLHDNIKYGKIDATDDEVFAAAKNAHAHEFIIHTPKGYGTFVGERGIKLSGGERQRVAIARAMLKNAPILILDEATSSLDSRAEKLIQDALEKLMQNRTTLIIAHRLSTLREMDEIIVFDNGEIVERGTHRSLLRKKGKYAELWAHQVGGFLTEKDD